MKVFNTILEQTEAPGALEQNGIASDASSALLKIVLRCSLSPIERAASANLMSISRGGVDESVSGSRSPIAQQLGNVRPIRMFLAC